MSIGTSSFFREHVVPMLKQAEGGYVNHPSDRGGETNHGWTVAQARKYGWTGAMRDMPLSWALEQYERRYVVEPGFDEVAKVSVAIAKELVDTGVNMGPGVPSTFFQLLLSRMNRRGKDYPNLRIDGDVGPTTVGALKAFLAKRGKLGETVLLRALNSLQGERYVAITPEDDQNEDFLFGWFANRVLV